jgi:hypothetical protein
MASIWAKGYVALTLAALSVPVVAAAPGKSAIRPAPASNPLAHSRFKLPAKAATASQQRQIDRSSGAVRPAQFRSGATATIEGPSWRYRTSRRGPTFEMGALGGGTMENAPFLAHVAMAWKF